MGTPGTALGIPQLWCSRVFVDRKQRRGLQGRRLPAQTSASLSSQPLPLPRSTKQLNWASVCPGTPLPTTPAQPAVCASPELPPWAHRMLQATGPSPVTGSRAGPRGASQSQRVGTVVCVRPRMSANLPSHPGSQGQQRDTANVAPPAPRYPSLGFSCSSPLLGQQKGRCSLSAPVFFVRGGGDGETF